MKPSIDQINETLNDEQKIQIHSIDEQKSKVIYDSVIRMGKLQNVVPLMYNSNIGTTLLGYRDKKDIQKFLRAEPIPEKKPIKPMPQLNIEASTKKDLEVWKKDVILWYEENKNNLPSNVIPKDRMIDMVYKQYMAYKTKPATVESRLSALEEKVDKILEKIS
jgi:polyhydroxyalkanoate synthesis regulator phasin